ncbi:DNA-directed RNA polymerase, mitochondrial [Galendromus occidentalis]|uniref:DNA-directed RNA polymerase n=1 Tax=Galendromus occidentalis TaxID=34638 RepID=A0AAJ7L5F6_9ACAR|nr:DNA-directed RNA polymerase, mitochondrial [Galendromus occidentalis]
MSRLERSPIKGLVCRRLNVKYSSTTTRVSPQIASNAAGERSRREPVQIGVGARFNLNSPADLREIIEEHSTELRKTYELHESPEISLMIPGNFQFTPSEEESAKAVTTGKAPRGRPPQKKKEVDLLAREKDAYLAQRDHIISSLRSYVDVSVNVGQHECALQAVNYYRWYLRKLHHRSGLRTPEPFPVDIYNLILSGCVISGDYKLATDIKQIMTWDNVNMDATTYAYLLATAKGQDDRNGLLKRMSDARITLEDLFRKTPLTNVQLAKLVQNIRCCSDNHDFEVPPAHFPPNKSCSMIADLSKSRQPFSGDRFFTHEVLRQKSNEQKSRELAGTVSVKSIAAIGKPSPRVTFLRKQIAKCENEWRRELNELFIRYLENATNEALHLHHMSVYPYLLALDRSTFVDLMVQEMRAHAMASESFSMSFTYLASQLGQRVEVLYHIRTKIKGGVFDAFSQIYDQYLAEFDPRHTTPSREIWQSLISKNPQLAPCIENHQDLPWTKSTRVSVGRFLYSILRQLKVDVNILKPNCEKRELMNALYSVYRANSERKHEELRAHKILSSLYSKAEIEDLRFDASFLPMLCPPKPWTRPKDTPFLISGVPLIRVMPDVGEHQMCAINDVPPENIYPALDALNVLSRTPWRVNVPVLDVLTTVFLGEGDKKLSVPKDPAKMVQPDIAAIRAQSKSAARTRAMQFRREKAENFSLWCDMLYKLSIAHHFKHDVFFFPHNMDFRGRVYPCPPHFHHLGGDVIRGLLLFAEGKPLGEKGLWWLKLHLINLTGFKKRRPIEERVAFADEIMDEILDSAQNPLTGRKWWQTSDDPWQTLAACKEIANALASPEPEKYICHLPIHQDGSCNGLQHYAALGRDLEGALQVNLVPMDAPQDVYSGIADTVESLRQIDSANGVEIATILEGHIKRKVVKQTVMTVVYGVTRFGAHLQILRQLQDLEGFPSTRANSAAHYLVGKTFESLEKMFSATREIQNWFTRCARTICFATDRPVQWTTPLGLPVVQPYFLTSTQRCVVESDRGKHSIVTQNSKPHGMKQKNGFPPNYIHSLDSSHMMLTAMYCEAAGINFVSVHDCFWTHVSTVDEMSRICREQFVSLHSEPLLERLSDEFRRAYIHGKTHKIPDQAKAAAFRELQTLVEAIPDKGEYDLKSVLKSRYFFS